MADFYAGLASEFPLVSIEDGVAEDDWDAWQALTERLGESAAARRRRPVRDQSRRLRRGIDARRRQLDPDQGQPDRHADRDARGDRARAANGYAAVISHRSGETEDATIADLAVATGAGQIKTGAPARTDRVAKYNQLLRIEEELGAPGDLPGLGRVSSQRAASRGRVLSVSVPALTPRRTKIVATIGPAAPGRIDELVERRHGRRPSQLLARDARRPCAQRPAGPRGARRTHGKPLALIADLQGPKIRVSDAPETRSCSHAATRS